MSKYFGGFVLLYIFYWIYNIFRDRIKSLKRHKTKQQSQGYEELLQKEHIAKLFEERVIDNFILTGAAVPCLNNKIKPVEGYRTIEIDDGAQYYKVIVALSAEKIFDFLIDGIHLIGDSVNISIADHGKDADKIHEYFCFSKDTFNLESMLSDHKSLIINNGDIFVSFWSDDSRIEMQLDRVKLIIFYTEDILVLEKLFGYYEVQEKKSLRFFPEEEFVTRNEFFRSPELINFLGKLEIEDTKTYNAEAD